MTTQESSTSQSTAAREAKEKAGERLGLWLRRKWRLDQLLGVGGMAAVYSATHRNGSRAAIKILHIEFARDEAVKQRFLREGYVANRVDHPGRVAILDDDETELGEPYLVMELLEGETLQQLWKRKKRKVPVIEALGIAEHVLDTLVPFHECKVVHRDLKPANIFVCNDGQIKLLDFGVAQLREAGGEALTRAGTALGTPSYMSPEQAMGKSDTLDGRSDVFAVGATLYAVLSGQRLHYGKSDNEAFILAATQPAPSLARSAPELPVEVIALVDKALQWDRRNRFETAGEMRDECRRVRQLVAVPTTQAAATPVPVPAAPVRGTPKKTVVGLGPPDLRRTPVAVPAVSTPSPLSRPTAAGVGPAPSPLGGPPAPPSSPLGMPSGPLAPASGPLAPVSGRISVATEPHLAPPGVDEPAPSGPPDVRAHLQQQQLEQEASKIKEVFERIERALPTFRQYGLDHPEAATRVRAVFRSITDALREDPDGLCWTVHPFCFTRNEVAVWEPAVPHDVVPYNLCAAGVEEVRIARGVTEREVAELLRVMLVDSSSPAYADVDLGAMLWEARFDHILCKVRDDMTEADATEQARFFAEADDLEQMAREDLAEVAAMAVSTDKKGWEAAQRASAALELEPADRAALGAHLSLDPARWRQRFLVIGAEAYADAVGRRDASLALEPLARHVMNLLGRERYRDLFEVFDVLVARLAALPTTPLRPAPSLGVLAAGLFPPEVLRQLLRMLASGALVAEDAEVMLDGVRRVLDTLDASFLEDALALSNQLPASGAVELLVAYVQKHLAGNEAAVIARLDSLNPPLAQRCLALVTASRNQEAIAMLRPLLASSNPALRCEATALLSPSLEELGKQLLKLLESGDPRLRSAALTTMVRYNARPAGPGLVRLIESFEEYMARPIDEQRQMLESLHALHPARAETLLVSVLDQHGLMADERLDRSRTIAAQVLGQHAVSDAALEALENAARPRPWNTPPLRLAAGAAAEAIGARLRRARAGGEEGAP